MGRQKKHRLLIIRDILIGLVCTGAFLLLTINVSSKIYAEDLLNNAFYPAKTYQTVIDLGSTKNAVGNEFFNQGLNVGVNLGQGCMVNGHLISQNDVDTQLSNANYTAGDDHAFCQQVLGGTWDATVLSTATQAPLTVRIAKRLLRITIVLSITMVIYNGIMYIIEASKGAEVKDTAKDIGYIIGGILLALMSLGIINLISSITVSSLGNANRTGSQNFVDKGCIINGRTIAKGDPLKQYVCENSFNGTWDANRIGNRCQINGTWKTISDGEEQSMCAQLGGVYKGALGIACKTSSGDLKFGNGLGEYICLYAGFGHPGEIVESSGTIAGRKWIPVSNPLDLNQKDCLINGEMKKILDSERESKCKELGGSVLQQ